MSTQEERARALVWAGCFVVELAHNPDLALEIRRRAVTIARHLPTFEEVSMSLPFDALPTGTVASWADEYELGPLRYSTRLNWPHC